MNHEYFMMQALDEAKKAYEKGEVPIGAVLVIDGEIVSRAHNTREKSQQAIDHAEITVIKEACDKIGFWRLDNSYLYSTIEPCMMCSGAIVQARVENVIFGARDSKNGCCGSKMNIVNSGIFNHDANVIEGILEEKCSNIMKNFFRELREKKKNENRKCDKEI